MQRVVILSALILAGSAAAAPSATSQPMPVPVAAATVSGTPDSIPALFRQAQDDPRPPADGRYLESWQVTLDAEAIRQPATQLRLNLPDGQSEIVELTYWAPRAGYIEKYNPDDPHHPIIIPIPDAPDDAFSWRWSGKSENYTLAMTMVDGVVSGRISGAARRYSLDPVAVSSNRLGRITPGFWRSHPDERAERSGSHGPQPPAHARTASGAGTGEPPAAPAGGWDGTCEGAPPPGQHVIDVLVLYTQGVYLFHGESHANVLARMREVNDDANLALRNSGINNIVYSLRGVEFVPAPSGTPGYDNLTLQDALPFFSGIYHHQGAPYYSFPSHCSQIAGSCHVQARREDQWADIVALARADGSGLCGFSYANRNATNNHYVTHPGPAFERFAYFVFDPACNADKFNYAHELGHQLGLEHDPRNFVQRDWPGVSPACPGSFGHKYSAGSNPRFKFRTVMAEWDDLHGGGLGPPDCGTEANCPLVAAYSTPLFEYDQQSTPQILPAGTVPGAHTLGVAVNTSHLRQADHTRALRRIAPIVADYRQRPELIFAHGFE